MTGGALRPARWSDLAERDLGAIYEFLSERSPSGARVAVEGILAAVERLQRHPELGPRARLVEPAGDLRRLVWRDVCLYYRVREEGILILRIWDTRRDPRTLEIPPDPGLP